MTAAHDNEFDDLSATGTDAQVARLIASSSHHASLWLYLSTTNHFPLEADALAFAITHRLGLPLSDVHPNSTCACGATFDDLHPFSCRLNLAAGCGERHNLLRDKLAALCRHHALLDVTIEPDMHRLYPSLRHHQNRERPDLVIRGLSRDIHVDTTVLVPMMYSYATSVRNAVRPSARLG